MYETGSNESSGSEKVYVERIKSSWKMCQTPSGTKLPKWNVGETDKMKGQTNKSD